MQKIPLELAGEGMKLAKPVKNKRGMTLCSPGTELSGPVIERLSNMGVSHITVEGHPVETGEEEKTVSDRVQELRERFKNVEEDQLMRKIRDVFIENLRETEEQE